MTIFTIPLKYKKHERLPRHPTVDFTDEILVVNVKYREISVQRLLYPLNVTCEHEFVKYFG